MENVELTLMNWEIVPEAYYNQIMELKNKYDNPVIYLTENGCAYPDIIEDGKINDFKRIEFYKKYLSAVKKSIDDSDVVIYSHPELLPLLTQLNNSKKLIF